MSSEHDDRVSLGADDAEFVSRVADTFAPGELAPARRAELDAELRARVEATSYLGGWRTTGLAAVTAGALAIAALLAIDRNGILEPDAIGGAQLAGLAANPLTDSDADAWERGLLDPDWTGDSEYYDESEELPDDYVAIAGIFLDG